MWVMSTSEGRRGSGRSLRNVCGFLALLKQNLGVLDGKWGSLQSVSVLGESWNHGMIWVETHSPHSTRVPWAGTTPAIPGFSGRIFPSCSSNTDKSMKEFPARTKEPPQLEQPPRVVLPWTVRGFSLGF